MKNFFSGIGSFLSNNVATPVASFFSGNLIKVLIGIIILMAITIAGLSVSVYAYKKNLEIKNIKITELEKEKADLSAQIVDLKKINEGLVASVTAKDIELKESKASQERMKLIMKDLDDRLKKYADLAAKIEAEKDPAKKSKLAQEYYKKLFGGTAFARIIR